MNKRVLAATVLVMALLVLAAPVPARADRCSADVENVGSSLVGNHFFTQWQVQHDAGSSHLATVSFRYKIHYVNKRRTTLVERGFFREMVRGQGKRYTKDNISLLDPVDIISVDFDDINCFN